MWVSHWNDPVLFTTRLKVGDYGSTSSNDTAERLRIGRGLVLLRWGVLLLLLLHWTHRLLLLLVLLVLLVLLLLLGRRARA